MSVLTDASGNVDSDLAYTPWGEVRESSGTVDTDRRFTGQRLDGTGLYYYNARYYDPTLGRFISPDLIVPGVGNPQAWDRYAYVLNNPLRYTDPSGFDHRLSDSNSQIKSVAAAVRSGGAWLSEFRKLLRLWQEADFEDRQAEANPGYELEEIALVETDSAGRERYTRVGEKIKR